MKTHACKEDIAADERLGYISSARFEGDPMSRTSFSDLVKPSALTKSSDDALVDKGAEAPKTRLSPMKMRMLTPAGSLLHAGSASTTLERIFPLEPFPWSFGKKIEKRDNYTTTCRKNFNELTPSCRRKVIERKSR